MVMTISNGHKGEVVKLQIPGNQNNPLNGKVVKFYKANHSGFITVIDTVANQKFLIRPECISHIVHCPHSIQFTKEEKDLINKKIKYMHLTAGDKVDKYGSGANNRLPKGATLKKNKLQEEQIIREALAIAKIRENNSKIVESIGKKRGRPRKIAVEAK